MKRLNTIQKTVIALLVAFAVAVPVVVAQSTSPSATTSETGEKKERRAKWEGKRGGKGEGRFGRRGGRRGFGGSFRNLDLTDAQKAQMKQLRDSHRQSIQPLVAEIRAKRQELRQANANGAFNEALASQKLAEIAPLEARLMAANTQHRQQTLAVLTPEQKAKMEAAREAFKAKAAERRARKQKKTE